MKIVKRVLAFGLSVIMLLSTGLISLAEDNSYVPEKGTRALTIIQPEQGSLSLEGEYERQEDGAYMIVPGEEITAILETDEGWQADAIILNGEKQEMVDNKAVIVMPDTDSLLQAEVSEIAVDPEADEVDETEEIPQAETVDETQGDPSAGINEIALFSAGDTITSAYIKKGSEIPGSIDVTRWDGDEWTNLKNWSEGVLGTTDGEWLFCANPEQHFKEGISMTAHDASEYYSEDTIKKLCGVLYYTDQVICNRLTAEQAYMIRQGYIWTVLNEESAWYTGGDAITVEYGNGLTCACGQGISTHYSSYFSEGLDWAEEHKDQLEASGDIYVNGDNQPLSRWTYEYHPTGHVTLKKSSANPDLTNGNSCYSFEDAQYGVYKDEACQNQVGTLTVNSNGESDTIELDVGSYYVKEIKAPKGYALDGQVYPVTVTEGATAKVEVQDLPQSDPVAVLLGKIDADTTKDMPQGSASLEGAEFTVKYYSGYYESDPSSRGVNPVRTWVMRTNKNGFVRFDNTAKVSGDDFYYQSNGNVTLPLGTITIQETKAPTGYKINDEVFVRQITSEGYAESVTTYNEPTIPENVIRGGVKIEKWDNETAKHQAQGGASLEGAKFQIISQNDNAVTVDGKSYNKGEVVKTLTTDKTGTASTGERDLPYGDYLVKEQTPPTGYLMEGVLEQRFSIREDGVVINLNTAGTSIRDNVIRGGVKIEKWDNETAKREPQGSATLKDTKIQIISDNENPVIVNGKSYDKGEAVKILTTDENGSASTGERELPYGNYIAKEQTPPTGYQMEGVTERKFSIREDGVTVNLNTADTAIRDNVIRGGVKLEKWDNETGEKKPQGSATLKGAVVDLITLNDYPVLVDGKTYSKDQVIHTYTTDENYTIEIAADKLPYGRYKFVETKAPEGYNNTGKIEREFEITKNGQVVQMTTGATAIRNDVIRGDVQLVKFKEDLDQEEDQKTPLDGIVFTLTSKTTGEVFEIVTDENGYASTKQLGISDRGNLVYDTYIVHEENTPEGLDPVDDFEVTISEEGQTLYYILEDKQILSPIQLFKADATTGERIPIAGAEFQLLDADKEPVTMTTHYPDTVIYYTFETDENGSFILPEKLPVGVYYFREVNAPNGYLRGEDLEFEITEGHDWMAPMTVEYEDIPAMGKIHITKTDALTGDLLYGSEFTITAAEDIVTGDGTVRAEKGEVVDKVTTDKEGTAESKELYLGKYTVTETKQPGGYAVSDQPWNVELRYAGQDTAIVTEEVDVENTPTELIIQKVTDSGEPLAGVVFKVWNKAMAEGEDTEFSFKEDYVTDERGQIVIRYLQPGTYCIQETEGIPGYAFEGEIREITIGEDGRIDGDTSVTVTEKNSKTKVTETNAVSVDTKTQLGIARKDAVIRDTVSMVNLQKGQEYRLKMELIDTETMEQLKDAEGNPVSVEKKFKAEKSEMDVDIEVVFDASGLAGRTITVFDGLYIGDKEVAAHKDINAESQQVVFPAHEIGTTALNNQTGSHEALVKTESVNTDTVAYEGLIPGLKYLMKAVVMDQETGKPLEIDGKELTLEKEFIPEKESGELEMKFEFDASDLAGKSIVFYEYLSVVIGDEKVPVAEHEDITDKEQTITFVNPQIGTTALDKESGTHNITAGKDTVIIDTVAYEGLIPGLEYELRGVVIDKESGEAHLENGKGIWVSKTFVPEEKDGSVEMEFHFDTTGLEGKDFVIFEYLYQEDELVTSHEDINDAGQTVHVLVPQPFEEEEPEQGFIEQLFEPVQEFVEQFFDEAPKTGDGNNIVPVIGLACLAGAVGTGAYLNKKRREKGGETVGADSKPDTEKKE